MTTATLSPADLAVDHALAEIALSFRFLLDLTPVDVSEQRRAFVAGATGEPEFTYRQLEDDPAVLEERIAAVEVGRVEDPILATLLRDKRRELELQVQMLAARGTPDFLPLSLELYGGVAPALRDRAEGLLEQLPPPAPDGDTRLDAEAFAALARAEVEHYRSIDADVTMSVAVRPDVAGILVSGDQLLVADTATVPAGRAQALLHHEVGTHLVTHVNGAHQPIRLLAAGLAGYEGTQEGLAILAEHLVGGLTTFRLRQLAARVVAVDRIVAGEEFGAVVSRLVDHGLPVTSAFTTVMRASRAGGLTKDAIYLRGLLEVLEHLAEGGSLDLLWLGKFSLQDLPLVDDLHARGALVPPRVLPRMLDDAASTERLRELAHLDDLTRLIGTTP